LPVDRPDVEPAFASVDFSNLHGCHFVRLGGGFVSAKRR
jgi:hypothetical protein